jgi:large subunit ribosomal protein L41
LDEKVRVYVAPPIEDIEESEVRSVFVSAPPTPAHPWTSLPQLKPYVALGTRLSEDHKKAVFSSIHGPGGITPARFLRVAQEQTYAALNPAEPVAPGKQIPAWMQAQINLKMRTDPTYKGVPFTQYRRDELALNARKENGPRQLEIVEEKPASPSS